MASNRERWNDRSYRVLAVVALGLLMTGTVAFRLLEGWSWVDSFYFSVVAVTTVGFGDLTPSTDGSKIFTALYLLSGISIITAYLNLRFQLRTADRGQGE